MDISLFARGIKVVAPMRAGAPEKMTPPGKVTLLLRQGEGEPCRTVVKAGDAVDAGQCIAEAVDAGTAELHSPIAGNVVGITEVIGIDGRMLEAVVIEAAEGEANEEGQPAQDSEPLKQTADELLDRIRKAGVVQGSRGGRSFAQVIVEARASRGFIEATSASIVKPLEHLAIRLCDPDPYLSSLAASAEGIGDDTADFELGVAVLAKLTTAAGVHLVQDKRQDFTALQKLADGADWSVHRIDSRRYPLAADPFVIKTVSGREPPTAFHRSHESGSLVVDVSTVLEVARAVRDGQPVVERLITVQGPHGRKVLQVPLGSAIADVVAAAGQRGNFGKVVLGGPLSGVAHHTLDYPVTKTISGITLLPPDAISVEPNDSCVSCGLCVMACPTRLIPGLLSRYCEFEQFDQAEAAHLFSCIECGCCAYVCPAGRSMVQFMIHGKTEIAAARRAS